MKKLNWIKQWLIWFFDGIITSPKMIGVTNMALLFCIIVIFFALLRIALK